MSKMKGSIIMDIDGVLCPIKLENESYSDLKPNTKVIERIREWQEMGFNVVLSTSRNMRTYQNNVGKINKETIPVLIEWLNKWNIPYDELHVGKPWPGQNGFYVDDRAIRPDEFIRHTLEELNAIMENGRNNLI